MKLEKKEFFDKNKVYSLTKRARKIREHFITWMLPTLLVKLHSIAYLWVRVVGCNHEFGYHLTDIHLTERHFVISSLRPDHTAMNKLPKMTTVALCTNPTSPRCDHDNHHHKPPTLLWALTEKGTLLSYIKYPHYH